MVNLEIEHTTEGVINKCKDCGAELISILHKCNPFRDIREQPCLHEQSAEEAIRLGKPIPQLCLSCPCPKCSPRC